MYACAKMFSLVFDFIPLILFLHDASSYVFLVYCIAFAVAQRKEHVMTIAVDAIFAFEIALQALFIVSTTFVINLRIGFYVCLNLVFSRFSESCFIIDERSTSFSIQSTTGKLPEICPIRFFLASFE